MKRTIIKFVIIILIFALAGCDIQDAGTMVCLGDSITEGFGASQPSAPDKTKSWPAFLQNKVKITVKNAGISGDTAADGLARVDKDVLSKNPQIVIILLGGNDFLRQRPASETKNDLQAIINRVKKEERKVYLASFIGDSAWEAGYLQSFPSLVTSSVMALLADYKKMYSDLRSENADIGVISNIWKDIGKDQMSDPIHPNAAGYSKMAENIFAGIQPYLAEKNLLK